VRKPFAWLRCEGQGSCLLRKIGIPVSEGNEDFSEVGAVFRRGMGGGNERAKRQNEQKKCCLLRHQAIGP